MLESNSLYKRMKKASLTLWVFLKKKNGGEIFSNNKLVECRTPQGNIVQILTFWNLSSAQRTLRLQRKTFQQLQNKLFITIKFNKTYCIVLFTYAKLIAGITSVLLKSFLYEGELETENMFFISKFNKCC